MTSATIGRFWAVGVGPGNPELLTLKALRVLQCVQMIFHAGPEPQRGRAWEIVRRHLRPEQEPRPMLTTAMSVVTASDWRTHYRPGVEQIAAECRAGRQVAFITEGDPTLYSTAACVWQLLTEIAPEIPVEVVPGVSSVTAAAARVGWPLARKDESIAVLPANYHAAALRQRLREFSTVCLLKPSQTMAQIVEAVTAFGGTREAVYVENLGTEQEWISPDLTQTIGRKNYFSLVLVRSREKAVSPVAATAQLHIVGLGPGDPRLLTQQARDTLEQAEVIVGYEAYLQSLAPLALGADLCGSPIGAETERARQALQLARQGRRVALVSSGDAGVYGMASLLLETSAEFPNVEVEVVPGVTAASAAAALLGAPLGHDFACISLSDLLTPWETIETRLDASGRADFVLAIYNPVSQRRTWQLPRAREVLLRHRSAETPVGIVERAHRPDMRVRQTTLGALTADGIGMETILIIGNSQTRQVNGRLVTPRGYTSRASGGLTPPVGSNTEGLRPPLATSPGKRILDESFAIIDRELGPLPLPPWARAVVRRMIHASADFDFANTLRHSPNFETAFREALSARAPIITDTEMVLHGIRSALADTPGVTIACHLNDPETRTLAETANLTRSAAAIRIAARRHASAILAIGNAPTALDEALRLVTEHGWRPAVIVGMPVGFVGVEEAKGRLLAQEQVPYLTCVGRKGGSAVTAAAINALVEWGRERSVS